MNTTASKALTSGSQNTPIGSGSSPDTSSDSVSSEGTGWGKERGASRVISDGRMGSEASTRSSSDSLWRLPVALALAGMRISRDRLALVDFLAWGRPSFTQSRSLSCCRFSISSGLLLKSVEAVMGSSVSSGRGLRYESILVSCSSRLSRTCSAASICPSSCTMRVTQSSSSRILVKPILKRLSISNSAASSTPSSRAVSVALAMSGGSSVPNRWDRKTPTRSGTFNLFLR
mmetsp:Transcript_36708/g.105235  ORF Transcript_36708/g.105235 Transcript_36708/m.105235 type:complete len:231 (+) Transcript_36708:2029-2721(+)